MKNIGEYLKNSRIEKRIEIGTIAKNLNISKDLINKIENDDLAIHLDKVYLTGHVRAYAKYLNLDENEIVKQFKVQTTFAEKDLVKILPKPLEKNNLFLVSKGVAFFSMILIISGFYFFFIRSNDLQPEYSLIPDLPENLQSEVEEVEMEIALKEINEKKSKDSLNVSELSAVASLPTTDEINNQKTNIILKFLNSTWIQLRNENNEIVFSKLMNKNNEYAYSILDNYALTAGNAGNIVVIINGESRGKAGKNGEVIESLIISSDFNN